MKRSSLVVAVALIGLPPPCAPGWLSGQEFEPVPIRGRVIDAGTLRPVPGAVVRFMAGAVTGVTDSTGSFRLDLPPDGRYPLRVEQLGYETTLVVLPSTAPVESSTVTLTAKPLELQGIEVTVDRFGQRRRWAFSRARVVDAARLSTSLGGTFDVVIRAMVGGRPCSGDAGMICRQRRGQQQVTVCIDDVVAYRHREELERYEPSDLYMIEVTDDFPPFSVRVYTREFVYDLASGERWLRPWRWGCSG